MFKVVKEWLSSSIVNHAKFGDYLEPLIQPFFPGWTANGFRAKVMLVRDESPLVYSLVLKPDRSWKGFRAGQYIELTVEKNGARLTRIFSISSNPDLYLKHGIIELTIRKQEHGRITPWLRENLKSGKYAGLSVARGDFVLSDLNQPLLFIAGGSGITPFRSFLGELSLSGCAVDVHLFYYAKHADHLFVKELKAYEEQITGLTISFINTDEAGIINEQQLQQRCDDFTSRKAYICGPGGMIEASEKILLNQGVISTSIHYEYFGPAPTKDISIDNRGEVLFERTDIKVASKSKTSQTLLELAETAGLKPITGCRMGVCHQCICQKKRGVIYNTLTQAFSDPGQEEVQLCVSVAVGDVVLEL